MKLKKNNIYLMHFVQPATAMLSDLAARPVAPNHSTGPVTLFFFQTGLGVCVANPSFLNKIENRDGELPTGCSGQEEMKAERTSSS